MSDGNNVRNIYCKYLKLSDYVGMKYNVLPSWGNVKTQQKPHFHWKKIYSSRQII